MNVTPTTTCFDDTMIRIIKEVIQRPRSAHRYTVVHAVILLPNSEQPAAHAWLERDGHVLNPVLIDGEPAFVRHSREFAYAIFRPQRLISYPALEAYKQYEAEDSAGPWNDEILTHCAADEMEFANA